MTSQFAYDTIICMRETCAKLSFLVEMLITVKLYVHFTLLLRYGMS